MRPMRRAPDFPPGDLALLLFSFVVVATVPFLSLAIFDPKAAEYSARLVLHAFRVALWLV